MSDSKALNLQFEGCLPQTKVVEKLWGKEIWAINNDNYCLKFMELKPRYQCSLHRHHIKTETFIMQKGWMLVETMVDKADHSTTTRLFPGDTITIPVGVWHRFWNPSGSVCQFLEVSTHHEDEDVERMAESQLC